MATRIEKILTDARRTLADPSKNRWSDEDLLTILSEGQLDFVTKTEFLQERVDIPIIEGTPFFDLPDDCFKLTRVLFNNAALPFITHHYLDRRCSDWEEHTGIPKAIVYDRHNFNTGKLYPIPLNLASEALLSTDYGVVVDPTDVDYGVTTGIVNTSNALDSVNDTYGIFATALSSSDSLRCYYLKTPPNLTSVLDDLDIPQMYDIALKFYVCGQAFMNDIDTGYQQKGAVQMQVYEQHVRNAKKTSMQDAIRAGAFQTEYRRGV